VEPKQLMLSYSTKIDYYINVLQIYTFGGTKYLGALFQCTRTPSLSHGPACLYVYVRNVGLMRDRCARPVLVLLRLTKRVVVPL
jgi:hypothetical protein